MELDHTLQFITLPWTHDSLGTLFVQAERLEPLCLGGCLLGERISVHISATVYNMLLCRFSH